jgi:hypothetical protein
MTDTSTPSFVWQVKQRKDYSVKDHTKLGIFLLVPPFLLWAAVITFMLDRTLGEYIFSLFTRNSLDVTFFIAGMIFPGAAIAAAAWGLHQKQDVWTNITVTLLGVLFLTLVVMQLFL